MTWELVVMNMKRKEVIGRFIGPCIFIPKCNSDHKNYENWMIIMRPKKEKPFIKDMDMDADVSEGKYRKMCLEVYLPPSKDESLVYVFMPIVNAVKLMDQKVIVKPTGLTQVLFPDFEANFGDKIGYHVAPVSIKEVIDSWRRERDYPLKIYVQLENDPSMKSCARGR